MSITERSGGNSEYREGPEALKKFEDGMKKLFQAKEPESPFKPPPPKPKEEPSKGRGKRKR